MKKNSGKLIFSATDLIRYTASPFASWMERLRLESPDALTPDVESADKRLIAETGDKHELMVLTGFRADTPAMIEIPKEDEVTARTKTVESLNFAAPVIYQAYLELNEFAGYADFLIRNGGGGYQVWDTKLARAPKPYYAVQLCCYSEMLAHLLGTALPERFGIILGTKERVEFRVEDYIYYYRSIKAAFLEMQLNFNGKIEDRPEPHPRADHGRWTSYAEKYFEERDHLVRVAGISIGQIKKLKKHGITTMAGLAKMSGRTVPKLATESLERLVAQARLQCETLSKQKADTGSAPAFELLMPLAGESTNSLAFLPAPSPGDVFFDMEGYPLVAGGLEYLFGAATIEAGTLAFHDWWAHDRVEEKLAFEAFVDWAFKRWKENPGMHIFHYASYEVSALRRLSTRHDTRQEQVDQLLRNRVFIDLYQVVRHALRIGTEDYSIKTIERLYRPKRATGVATAADSIVGYAKWIESREDKNWTMSLILKGIRDYNEDDCKSTVELFYWLRKVAEESGIAPVAPVGEKQPETGAVMPEEVERRLRICRSLRAQGDPVAVVLGDLIEFHRREAKPIWWRMFDRASATEEELRDDPGCIASVKAIGHVGHEKQSFLQSYSFDPSQECKLVADEDSRVMFAANLDAKLNLKELDGAVGTLTVKIGKNSFANKLGWSFPSDGSLLEDEYVHPAGIPDALADVAEVHLSKALHPPALALINRIPAAGTIQRLGETAVEAAIRVASEMQCGCFVIQGPPGTGKTFTASHVISALLARGKRVGITSNSHKAIENLLKSCGEALASNGGIRGIKVGSDGDGELFEKNPMLTHVEQNPQGYAEYDGGVVAGTAWLFTRDEWKGVLDYLFIDEAGQVSLANAVAMSRCARNLILLGDQMQLEQPVQGSHPGDAGLSVLQYALKDTKLSRVDSPIFHSVVPSGYGLFLGESRRMHPDVCRFISESSYEGRLKSSPECANQKIALPANGGAIIRIEKGIAFIGVKHDGNIQQSAEEIEQVQEIYRELAGRV
jgi:uncharacterized protein